MRALVIGATGATGKDLVTALLDDPNWSEVTAFVRRRTNIVHPKLTEVITDFGNMENVSGEIHGDVLFSCLGTTLAAAGSKENQRRIDYEIPANFARLAHTNGVPGVVLLSAYGASSNSRLFYSMLKGELENELDNLGFLQYIIFRPGLLLRKNTDRLGERLFSGLLKLLNNVGLFRKFKPMPTSLLADKMVKSQSVLPTGKHILELNEIFVL